MVGLETKPRTRNPADQPVFVAGDGRRARRLRNAAIVAGLLAVLWVVGLGIGLVGFGSLPGVGLVKGARADSRPDHPRAVAAAKSKAVQRHLAADVISIRKRSTASAIARFAASRAAGDQSR